MSIYHFCFSDYIFLARLSTSASLMGYASRFPSHFPLMETWAQVPDLYGLQSE